MANAPIDVRFSFEGRKHQDALELADLLKRPFSIRHVVTGQAIATYHYRKIRKAIREDMQWGLELAEHFALGNVIFSDYWRDYDLVLEFHAPSYWSAWSVDVVRCSPQGFPKPSERARNHCTFPDRRDIVMSRSRIAA